MPWVLPVVNLLSAPNPSHGGPLATRLFRTSWQDRTRHMFARAQCRPAVESHRIPPVYKVKLQRLSLQSGTCIAVSFLHISKRCILRLFLPLRQPSFLLRLLLLSIARDLTSRVTPTRHVQLSTNETTNGTTHRNHGQSAMTRTQLCAKNGRSSLQPFPTARKS